MRIIVINDLHPDELAGAATIALQNAELLSKKNDVEFWYSGEKRIDRESSSSIKFMFRPDREFLGFLRTRLQAVRVILEIINFRQTLWLWVELMKRKPDLVWIHQVGNHFPKIIPLICKSLGIRSVQTHHDYSIFRVGKLYPIDLKLNDNALFGLHAEPNGFLISNQSDWKFDSRTYMQLLLTIRRKVLVSISNMNFRNITISSQQTSLLKCIGITKVVRIPNFVSACNCKNPLRKVLGQTTILFAGRPNGKGLDRVCWLVKNSPNSKLLLAGDASILSYLPEDFPKSKLDYLGVLSQSELFNVMHGVNYVSVLSTCFDVYPSILLEALTHEAKVLTTTTVGNCSLIQSENTGYLLPYSFEFKQSSLEDLEVSSFRINQHDSFNRLFSEVDVQHFIQVGILDLIEAGSQF